MRVIKAHFSNTYWQARHFARRVDREILNQLIRQAYEREGDRVFHGSLVLVILPLATLATVWENLELYILWALVFQTSGMCLTLFSHYRLTWAREFLRGK